MKKPQVVIDGLVFESDYQIGIWRVFYETMRRSCAEIDYVLLLAGEPLQPIPDGVTVEPAWHRIHPPRFALMERISKKRNRLDQAARLKNAIWHSTFFTADPLGTAATVVTVFDMIAEQQLYKIDTGSHNQRAQKAESIPQADHILAISEKTAEDVVRFHPEFSEKFTVMHLGAEHLDCSPSSEPVRAEAPYALFVGSRFFYKNFQVVIEALSSNSWPDGIRLRVVGSPFSSDEKRLHSALGIASKIDHVGRVSDEELATHYQNATCFLFPSLAEGFGIPVIEAQAHRCVAVIADTPIFREVAGEGAVFFSGEDPNALCEAINTAQVATVQSDVFKAAKANLSRYSWNNASRITVETYKKLCEQTARS